MRRLRHWPVSVAHAENLGALTRPARCGGRYQRQLEDGSRRSSAHVGRSGERPGVTKAECQGDTRAKTEALDGGQKGQKAVANIRRNMLPCPMDEGRKWVIGIMAAI